MRRGELTANLLFLSPFLVFTTMIVSSGIVQQRPETYYCLSLCLLIVGFLFLLKAKIPNFRKMQYITFGTKGMTAANRLCYHLGAISAGIGVFLSFGLLFLVLNH